MSHGVGVRCLSVGRGNNRAVLEEVRPGMAEVDEKGERRLGQVQSRGLEGQPDAQNARNAGVSDVKAVQALNRNAHSGSAGGDQDVSLSIDYGNGLEASRKSGLTGKDMQQKAAEQQAGFRQDDRAKAKPGALVEDQSQTSTGTIIARQAEKNPALEPIKAYYKWATSKLEGVERETHQQLAREQLIAIEPQTKGALDALDQRRQTQAGQDDCGIHEVPKNLKESLQGQVSYPEKEIQGVRRLTPEDFKKLAMAMEVAGPAAEASIKQTTQEILVRTGESSRDTMLAGINLVVGLLKYDRDLLVNPAKAREEAGKAGEGLALLLVAGVHVSFGAAGTIEQARQSGDYSLPLRHVGAALNSWYEKQSPADQMAIMAEIGGGFGLGAFTGEASRLRKPGAFTAFLREGLEALPKNPEAERKALDTLTRLFKGREPVKEVTGLGAIEKAGDVVKEAQDKGLMDHIMEMVEHYQEGRKRKLTRQETADIAGVSKKEVANLTDAQLEALRLERIAEGYRTAFYKAYPHLKNTGLDVHHVLPQSLLDRHPGLFKAREIHSLKYLSGIPESAVKDGKSVHQLITNSWKNFLENYERPTRAQVLEHMRKLDEEYGRYFVPPLQKGAR